MTVNRQATEITYDAEANMAYVYVAARGEPGTTSGKQVVLTDEELPCAIVVDLDQDGRIVGFELFDAAQSLPLRLLDKLS